MIFICMIIAALVTTAMAKGARECSLSETTGAQKCYGALAEPLIFHLPSGENTKMMLIKNNKHRILKILNNTVASIDKEYINSAFFSGGIFQIDKATKEDSGDYLLETYAATNGVLLHKIKMHLQVQVPVSTPAVSQMCLSPEQMNISCSSEGDEVEFILTLDSYPLIQTRAHSQSQPNRTAVSQSLTGEAAEEDKSSDSNVNISLYGQLTGNLMCQVRNNVSRDKTVLQLTNCKASVSHFSHVAVAVIASAAILLLLLALLLGVKHLYKKTRSVRVNKDNAEDEVVYSDVRVMKQTRKPRANWHQNAT
ncbi:uncharacterized protein LOC126387906 [Epinephelus moara]|uniref:uncharacterized protein LOC126387906 n=1 Tax=Epinephelus moara TaxID=300413 RepID=UPI00214E2F1E|nr:uncharacterized protein LOC126387906 [Epinephelus moara]